MEVLEMENKTADSIFLQKKLTDTVKSYRARYPELGYITSGIDMIIAGGSEDGSIDLLERLNQYMHFKLSEYYVIKVIQQKFHGDVEAAKNGEAVDRSKDMYLEFAGFKEHTPIK